MNPSRSSNYFYRHWRGELSLAISFWVNVIVATMVYGGVQLRLSRLIDRGEIALSARGIGVLMLAVGLANISLWIWALVGLWRSAANCPDGKGRSFWTGLARGMVILLGLIKLYLVVIVAVPRAKEAVLIASGGHTVDPISVKLSADGRWLVLDGDIGEGSESEVRKSLESAPGVVGVMLDSDGGIVFEAQRIAHYVQARGLNTYVEGRCKSACTHIFLAGRERIATPNARIGFHQSASSSGQRWDAALRGHETAKEYGDSRLPPDFIDHIARTPADRIWYPASAELSRAGVVTRVSLGGEAQTMGLGVQSEGDVEKKLGKRSLFVALEARMPGTLREASQRGWQVLQQHGSDSEFYVAVREVGYESLPRILATADGKTLDRYLELRLDELEAAKELSAPACARAVRGELNVYRTLPKKTWSDIDDWLLATIKAPPVVTAQVPDPVAESAVLNSVRLSLTPQYVDAISNTARQDSDPDLLCNATIAFHQAIRALPDAQRQLAIRGLSPMNL